MEPNRLKPAVLQLFSARHIQDVMSTAASDYRARILRIEVVVLALLDFVICDVVSFLQVVDRLRLGDIGGLPAIHVSSAAFYKRLNAISHTVFLEILRGVTRTLEATRKHKRDWILRLAPFANGVYAIDDTTLDALMRRTKALKKHRKGAMETLGGRLGCAMDLTTAAFAEILYDSDSQANEKNHIRPLIERLGAGNLYVFDLGYFSFPFFDYLTEHYCYFVSRLRAKTSYKVIKTLRERPHYRDSIIYLGKYRADRAGKPVRLVELLIDGTWYRYITNMLDPKQLPAQNVWTLYAQRWTIEMSFAAVKRGLGMAFLHPSRRNPMLTQIWCTLAVYQVMQDLRLEVAATNGWAEDAVSWYNLTMRIGWYASGPGVNSELRTWLCSENVSSTLVKRGTRKRRREGLPDEVLRECRRPPSPPDPRSLVMATPRQSKPEPRQKDSLIVVAGLS